jgi:hypothetical protein
MVVFSFAEYKGSIAASRARIANMPVIPEKNVVRDDVFLMLLMTSFRPITRATSTIVPALCSPGWSENSIRI